MTEFVTVVNIDNFVGSQKGLKGTVVNWKFHSINKESFEITSTVPLSSFLLVKDAGICIRIIK